MLLIPELETVVILVPRTGSGSLKHAVLKRYPKAVLLYRHMEADGVPHGYDRWRRVGVVRDPVARMWSLYNFLAHFDGPYEPAYIDAQRRSVGGRDFETWLLTNETVFTSPYDSSGQGRFFPQYAVLHAMPETRKSQHHYLRPDLGTEVYQFSAMHKLLRDLGGLEIEHHNPAGCTAGPIPVLSSEGREHIQRWFRWDLQMTN